MRNTPPLFSEPWNLASCLLHVLTLERGQGGDDTFATFPDHLRVVISKALPAISVETAVYPKYETQGDLKECVSKFREWQVLPYSFASYDLQ